MTQTFSKRLRDFRVKTGLTQAQMGAKLGVSANYVGMIEGGREPSSTLIELFGLLEAKAESPISNSVQNRETENVLREESATGYTATPREPVPADARDTTKLLTEARDALRAGITSGRASYFKLALEILDELQDRLTIEGMKGRVQAAVKSVRASDAEEVQFK